MTPTRNLWVPRGGDYIKTFHYLRDDGVTPVDLTGFFVRADFRVSIYAESVAFAATTENGRITLTDAPAGEFTLTIPGVISTAIIPDQLAYDIEIINAEGSPTRFVRGIAYFEGEVTKPVPPQAISLGVTLDLTFSDWTF